jgi:hypothetical protein
MATRDGKSVKIPYKVRWGHERTRILKGHPKRAARRQRALARLRARGSQP